MTRYAPLSILVLPLLTACASRPADPTPAAPIEGRIVAAGQLPARLEFHEEGPQRYRFVCTYSRTGKDHRVVERTRLDAGYTRGLDDGRAHWHDATVAIARSADGPFDEAEPLDYLNRLTYDPTRRAQFFSPTFFREFPQSASGTYARNLVWDTHMIEWFAREHFTELRLNEAFTPPLTKNAPLAGLGTFRNGEVELQWIGVTRHNGEPCALIRYRALFGRFDVKLGRGHYGGLSHYWGEIAVSLLDQQVEHATLSETVEVRVGDGEGRESVHHVFRTGTLSHSR